jgi:tripartite-type tricarboxylate transporter receptor subunit TctC
MRAAMRGALLLASASLAPGASEAHLLDRYPDRPVRVIVPAPVGSKPDQVARPVAERMAEVLRQPFVVDNRPAAQGAPGLAGVARAAADGYTVLVVDLAQIARHDATETDAREAARRLVAIAKLAEVPHALFVHPSLPVTSVRDVVALARAQPGRITYAGGGRGSFTDAATEALNTIAGIRLVRAQGIPGAGQVDLLLAGEAMIGFDPLYARLGALRHKRLRALAVGTLRRVDAAPSVPTFAEAGLGEFLASPWLGLFAPSGTPPEVVAKLDAAATAALESREMRAMLGRVGMQPAGMSRERFGYQVRDDIARFSPAPTKPRGVRMP